MYREPARLPGTDAVTRALDQALPKFSRKRLGDQLEFRRYKPGQIDDDGSDIIPVYAAWVNKRWRNDAVLHLGVPDNALDRLSALSLRVEQAVQAQIGYVFWLSPVNLHLVWSGQRLRDRTGHLPGILEAFDVVYRGLGRLRVDNFDPRSNLLSITVIDLVAQTIDHQTRGRGGRLHKQIAAALAPVVGATTRR